MFIFRRKQKDPSEGVKKKTLVELEKDVERANLLNKQLQEKVGINYLVSQMHFTTPSMLSFLRSLV